MISTPQNGAVVAAQIVNLPAPVAINGNKTGSIFTGVPTILLNGEVVAFHNPPSLNKGKLAVSFRSLLEAAGWQVIWVPAEKTGIATQMVDTEKDFLDYLQQYNIRARYPTDKDSLTICSISRRFRKLLLRQRK
jgi:hypothetical protein